MNYAAFLLTNKYQTGLLSGQSYGGLLPSCLVTDAPERATITHIEQLLSVQGVGIDCFDGSFNSFLVLPENEWPCEVGLNYHWRLSTDFNSLVKEARRVHEQRAA